MDSGLIDVNVLIAEATQLAPLPASAARLAGLVTAEDADMGAIAEAIRLDEALTGHLLGAANSALSGAQVEITSVDVAVVRLGLGRTLAVVLAGATGEALRKELPGYGLVEGELWRHSVASALAIERAPRYSRRTTGPEAFAAALLHDVGKLVLSRHLECERREAIRRLGEDQGMDGDEAERRVLSMGHAEVGARVVRHWGLPESIALGIEHHHSPLAAPDRESRLLCTQIHLADLVAGNIGCRGAEAEPPRLTPHLAGTLGITSRGFDELCADVQRRLDDVTAIYGA